MFHCTQHYCDGSITAEQTVVDRNNVQTLVIALSDPGTYISTIPVEGFWAY